MSLLETRSRAPTALRRRAHQGARWPWMLLPVLLFFAAFWLLPFARLLQTGLTPDRTTGQSGYWTAIAQPHYLQSLLNTLLLSLAVTLITLLIAAVVGCFLARQRFAGRGTLLAQLSMSLFHERGTLAYNAGRSPIRSAACLSAISTSRCRAPSIPLTRCDHRRT
ncbi:hypothetical protein OJE16_20315 [Pantoea tagorei]